jgi:hypothetical protein
MKTISSMSRLIAILAITALLTLAATAQKSPSTSGNEKSLIGVISDSMCGRTHMAKDKTPAECTRLCVKEGSKYALVVDQKVYTLEGHEAELDKLAGERATVKGKVSGNTVSVESVTAAKAKG